MRKKEKWKVITYVVFKTKAPNVFYTQEKCRVHILLFVVSYLSVNLWIIIVFVSFSTFFSILHYQQMILNRFNNFLLMSSVLFLFFFFTHTILFLFYYSISIGLNRTCRCKKRTFSFMRGFSSVFTSEKICFKRDEKSKFFCCFFK